MTVGGEKSYESASWMQRFVHCLGPIQHPRMLESISRSQCNISENILQILADHCGIADNFTIVDEGGYYCLWIELHISWVKLLSF